MTLKGEASCRIDACSYASGYGYTCQEKLIVTGFGLYQNKRLQGQSCRIDRLEGKQLSLVSKPWEQMKN